MTKNAPDPTHATVTYGNVSVGIGLYILLPLHHLVKSPPCEGWFPSMPTPIGRPESCSEAHRQHFPAGPMPGQKQQGCWIFLGLLVVAGASCNALVTKMGVLCRDDGVKFT